MTLPLTMPLLLQPEDNKTTIEGSSSSSQAAPVSFPCKLYALLEDAQTLGFDDVISWQATGKSFKIHKPDDFMENIVKRYSFACGKLKSFQRQLNIYGFKKVSMGPQKGGYQHKQFVRGKPERLVKISRQRISTDFKEAVDKKILEDATNTLLVPSSSSGVGGGVFDFLSSFEALPQEQEEEQQPKPQPKIHLEESEVSNLYDFFYPKDMETRLHIQKVLSVDDDETSATSFSSSSSSSSSFEDDSAHIITSRTTTTQADPDVTSALLLDSIDLDEFCADWDEKEVVVNDGPVTSCGPPTTTTAATIHNQEEDVSSPSGDLTFPVKLHLMLSNAERDNYSDVVSWTPSGDAFYVHKVEDFVEKVLPLFFDQSKYESFRRQLNLYQFQRVSKGTERGRISHPRFVRGARWMCQDIHSVRRR